METDTPETDKQLHAVIHGGDRFSFPEHARRMERERNDLRSKYAMHHAEAERLTKENAEMRKIIKRASYTYEPMSAQAWLDSHPENAGHVATPEKDPQK